MGKVISALAGLVLLATAIVLTAAALQAIVFPTLVLWAIALIGAAIIAKMARWFSSVSHQQGPTFGGVMNGLYVILAVAAVAHMAKIIVIPFGQPWMFTIGGLMIFINLVKIVAMVADWLGDMDWSGTGAKSA